LELNKCPPEGGRYKNQDKLYSAETPRSWFRIRMA
jgi:hypothetical protein